MEGISKKIYLELEAPTEDDSRSAQVRILDALKEKNLDAVMSLQVMRKLHPLCESTDWKFPFVDIYFAIPVSRIIWVEILLVE
jgi:hypothetical protein